jgi:hypothetical protein
VTTLAPWLIRHGDDPRWCDTAYDDSRWSTVTGGGLWASSGPAKGTCWYRKELVIPEPLDSLMPLALYQLAAVTASEVYWDGNLIAKNGQVGTSKQTEVPGRSGQIHTIPRTLTTPGRHVLALRVSNHHTFSGLLEEPPSIGYLRAVHGYLFRHGSVLVFLAGMFFFTALFHLALLLGYRDKYTYGAFSLFCISCAAHIVIRCLLTYFHMDLSYYYVLAAINDIPWFLMMALLPAFFLFEFRFPKREVLTTAIVCVAFCIVLLPRLVTLGLLPIGWLGPLAGMNSLHSYATILFSTGVSGWALYKRKVGCLTSTAGLLSFFAGVAITYQLRLDYGWALGFAVLIAFLAVSLSNQMAQRNREHQEAQLRAARLEIDLLRKHIQPHFLLNSLNSIVAWLEEDPATAARLVNALADELRMLLHFAREREIPLGEEVKLCETHLTLMGLRYGKSYEFAKDGIPEGLPVPPLVIHTLVENGLTHGYGGRSSGVFRLQCDRHGPDVSLRLFNDGSRKGPDRPVVEGTGLRYVRTRLEELYPGMWELRYGPVEGGWEVAVDIRRKRP